MTHNFPLDLFLVIEEHANASDRLLFLTGDKQYPSKPGFKMYGVPRGIGWLKNAWGGASEHPEPVLFYTGLVHSRATGPIPINRLCAITTIPSHTPGRKGIVLWKAPWAE